MMLDDDPSMPKVRAVFEVVDGVPQCGELTVSRGDGPGAREVRARDHRKVRLEDLLEDAVAAVSVREGEDPFWPSDDTSRRETVRQAQVVRKRSRRRLTDEVLREVAAVYRANPDTPTQAVGRHFGKASRTAGLYVQTARESTDPETGEPFLGEATKGKAGEKQ